MDAADQRPQRASWHAWSHVRLRRHRVDFMSDERLVLLARYTPIDWGDPPPSCVREHNWAPWRAHPNGVNDVRGCKNTYLDAAGKRRECPFSDWREHSHWWGDADHDGIRRCRMTGCASVDAAWL